jgi:hypothetical protein
MLHQTDLGNARMAQFIESARRNDERRQLKNRGSPPEHPLRHFLAVPLVLFGAKLNGEEPAVIGRVVIRDSGGHLPPGLRGAA